MDYLIVVERQFSYTKNILLARKAQFQESFENSVFEGEPTAAEVYIHGITSLYESCAKILTPEINESKSNLEINKELDLPEQYIDLYDRTLQILKEIQQKMTKKDLNRYVVHPLNPDTKISLLKWIGLNVMHTVTHVGQALRLQSLYIRNKLDRRI
ncbi:MAG: DinB family protein [Candidatus Hodarchaeota archaeon]